MKPVKRQIPVLNFEITKSSFTLDELLQEIDNYKGKRRSENVNIITLMPKRAYYSDDDYDGILEVYFSREETDSELQERLNREEQWRMDEIKRHKAQEKALNASEKREYLRLKAKFEKS